ncbi:hypothetical protein Zmor_018472 [Zophobas morio]|uniref:Gamma-glutamyltranspeptidase 1 n=1 Tax=Zophobas morio TaxID=2755281 RepID=A0AA38IA89_9CUCU|nr:hypothetical protein Zmor_018472 [Zophobas morio]
MRLLETLFFASTLLVTTRPEEIPTGVVVTNGPACAQIGTSILKKNGTAVDAAIASLFCEGVSVPDCMGLGGGFLMNIYIKDGGKSHFLVARETAPEKANETMFGSDEDSAIRGGLAVAVPGELRGYWEAYNKYGGGVAWKDLIQPTIDLCNEGIPVTKYVAEVSEANKEVIMKDNILREIFINPTTNQTYAESEKITRPRLAKTLQLIADYGADVLYNGALTSDFVKDIQAKGGIITEQDLNNYTPLWLTPIPFQLPYNQTLHAAPLPGSGLILGLIMNILNDFLDPSEPTSVTNWQRVIESFKFGFAKRTELGDPDFVDVTEIVNQLKSTSFAQELRALIFDNQTFEDPGYYGANVTQPLDHGTANMCVLAPNGDAVSVTSTINYSFGAGIASESTGIILNDQMDDFSSAGFDNVYGVPPSPSNYIVPGKRPMSSMNPSIVVDDSGDVRLVVGASGGTKIITSVALVMIKNLWFNYTIKDAVEDKRLHHQLFPMQLLVEEGYSQDFLDALTMIGHNVSIVAPPDHFNAVTSISREGGTFSGTFDPRRGGGEEYIYSTTDGT